jgi:hypothetical protein
MQLVISKDIQNDYYKFYYFLELKNLEECDYLDR